MEQGRWPVGRRLPPRVDHGRPAAIRNSWALYEHAVSLQAALLRSSWARRRIGALLYLPRVSEELCAAAAAMERDHPLRPAPSGSGLAVRRREHQPRLPGSVARPDRELPFGP